jgi:hypothetical protein
MLLCFIHRACGQTAQLTDLGQYYLWRQITLGFRKVLGLTKHLSYFITKWTKFSTHEGFTYLFIYFFFFRVLHRTNTVKVIWQLSSFTGGRRPQVPFHALFQAWTGTRVEPPTFSNLAGQLPNIKEFKVLFGFRTHSGEGQVVWSQHP